MSLETGQKIGPYEIVGKIGAGGMGDVFKARDTRLGRTAAIKVLPPAGASSPDRRARFQLEARAISSLNHPHICTLYDVGQENGIDFLVMEYLEGETLARRLERGPMQLPDLLRTGIEIADALAAAHAANIVHRDLKPANIMLTRSGVKLLDFGLAKLTARADSGVLSGTTMSDQVMTGEGVLLGTLPYMSPEQLEGSDADARSDVWALGTILYEMATGKRAFEAKSQASLIGAILKDHPPAIQTLLPLAPQQLDVLINACLEKDPEERWQSARDIARVLRWLGDAESGVKAGAIPRSRKALVVGAAALILALGGGLGWVISRMAADDRQRQGIAPARHMSIVLPADSPLALPSATPFNYLRPSFAISPDESKIVYVAQRADGTTQLYLRHADAFDVVAIPGSEGGFDPFFSPDGEWIGFFTFDSLLKVSLKGGAPLTLSPVVNPVGGAWCDNGKIYFSADEGDELWTVDGSGGTGAPQQIPLKNASAYYPQCLPGSIGLLLTMIDPEANRTAGRLALPLSSDYAAAGVLPLSTSDGNPRLLVSRGYAPQFADSGHLIFARGGSLVAAPFDLEKLAVTGPEITVLQGVRLNSMTVAAAQFAIGRLGSLLYVRGGDHSRTQLVWVDRAGRVTPTPAAPNLFGTIQVSPDGRRAAVEVGGIQDDIYVYDLQDGRRVRVTSDRHGGRRALWHPDGRRVVFFSSSTWKPVIKVVESDSPPEPLPVSDLISSWSRNGTVAGTRAGHIWVGSLENQETITSAGRGRAWGAVLASDSSLVAYTSSRTGTFQVFAQPNPPTDQEWQVSSDFGEEPVWSRASKELYFRRHNEWLVVPFTTAAPGAPRKLFEGPFFNAFGPSYDVAPDGRFLMALPPNSTEPIRELLWVPGWTGSLGKKSGGQPAAR